MALALDASTPAAVASATGVPTTASFNPPSNSLLVAKVSGDWFSGTPSISVTSSGATFERVVRHGANNQGVAEIWVARVGSGSRTVSATTSLGSSPLGLKVEVWTGWDPGDPIDAVVGGTGVTTNSFSGSLTTTTDNAWATGVGTEWNNLGAATSTDTNEHSEPGGVAMLWVRKAAAKTPAGSETLNFDASGTGAAMWTWAAIALRAATAGSPKIYRVADRGSAQNTTTSTSTAVDIAAGASITVGNYLIARVALDNAGTNGAAPSCTVTDPRSNSWTVLGPGNADPGAANAGSTIYVAYTKVTNAYSNGDDITFNHSPTTPAKAILVEEWTGIDATSPIAVTAVTGSGATSAVSLARTPTAADQVLYCALSVEGVGGDHYTQDTDITSGSWVMLNQIASTNATATNNQANYGTYKRVTSNAAQTWNATLPGSRDWAGVAFVLAPAAGASGTLAATLSTQTASMSGTASAGGTLSGTLAAQTASFAGTVSDPVTGTLAASVSAQTASMSATATASGSLAGTLAAETMSAAATAKTSGDLAGLLSAQIADLAASSEATGTLAATLAAQTMSGAAEVTNAGTFAATLAAQVAAIVGSAETAGDLVGQVAAIVADMQGTVQVESGSGILDGVLSPVTADFAAAASVAAALAGALEPLSADMIATASAVGTLAGALSSPSMTLLGTAEVADRDIIVVIGVGERPNTVVSASASGATFEVGKVGNTLETGPSTTSITAGSVPSVLIGVG